MNLGALIERYERRLETIAEISCTEASVRTQQRTAVDTGLAISRWGAGINGFNRNGTGSGFLSVAARLKLGDSYTFTNTTPYIRFLEYGTRKMSAQPMVGPTKVEWPSIVRSATRAARGGG